MFTLFFWLSKLGWMLVSPDSLLVLMLVASLLLSMTAWQRLARRLLAASVGLVVLIAILPVGEWLIAPLEKRFDSNPDIPARIDGIIVLGGAVDARGSRYWEQIQLRSSAERMTAFAALARHYPQASLVFTGGSGELTGQQFREAEVVPDFLASLGLNTERLIIEDDSRNTWENVLYSQQLLQPHPDEQWLLITSAFHMRRAAGIFARLDWKVIPYPVDHRSLPGRAWRPRFAFADNLQLLNLASREWLGLLVYRITGKTASLSAE